MRACWRAGWACPCSGAVEPKPDRFIESVKEMMRNVTGRSTDTCPWTAFGDPVVADIINAHRWYDTGQVHLFLGSDPPAHLVAGLEMYVAALSATRADRMDRESEERRKATPRR